MRITSLLAVGLVWCAFASDGRAQEAIKETPNNPAAIRKALDQKITLDYNGQSLEDTLEHLRQKSKLNISTDYYVVQQIFANVGFPGGFGAIGFAGAIGGGGLGAFGGGNAGFPGQGVPGVGGAGQGVHLKIDNGKVRTALQNLLTPYQLTFVILGNSVLITSEEVGQARQMRQRVSVDVKDQPLAEALKKLADDTGVNLLLDPRHAAKAKSKVTVELENVTLETAVRLLTEMADLGAVNVGNVLFVTSIDRADKIRHENAVNNPGGPFPGGLPPVVFDRVGAGVAVPGIPAVEVAPAPPKKGN